jgi:hypothetical protein
MFIKIYPENMPEITASDLSFISDSAGNKTAAIIPIELWNEIEREIASERETAYLSQSTQMKQRILESLQDTETITFEEACAKLGIQPERF